ncbi:MAG TPA: hypothetical protein VJ981_03665 [Gammaproteobacteria bacterium]|nr:hypothetical protein [Gammaproteobacteria bacterium]
MIADRTLHPLKYLLLPLFIAILVSACKIESSVEASGGLYTSDGDYHRISK